MRKSNLVALVGITTLFLYSCSSQNNGIETTTNVVENLVPDTTVSKTTIDETEKVEIIKDGVVLRNNTYGNTYMDVTLASGKTKTIFYDALDLEPEFDDFSALTIDIGNPNSLEEGASSIVEFKDGDVELKSGGIYVLKGTLNGGQVRIVDGFGERIQVVLDGVNINTDKENAIVSDCSARVLLRLADASINTLTSVNDSASKLLDAAILVKNDLSITGEGVLNVDGRFGNAIQSKGTLTFISGNYNINVPADGIKGKNGIIVKDGIFNVVAGDEGFKATDADNGFIFVNGGEFNIEAKGKGFSAEKEFILLDGQYKIYAAKECFEGKTVDIIGGNMELKTDDDAINATDSNQNKKSNQSGVYVSIKGGYIDIDSVTDGIDSNGDLYLDGGKIFINGPTDDNERIIDYNGDVRCKGTEMIAVGPGARMQDLGEESDQNYIVVYCEEKMPTGRITLTDETGNKLLSCDVTKGCTAAIITSPKIEIGKTYNLEMPKDNIIVKVENAKTEIRVSEDLK